MIFRGLFTWNVFPHAFVFIVGNREVDALLEMLDRDWEAGRKASE